MLAWALETLFFLDKLLWAVDCKYPPITKTRITQSPNDFIFGKFLVFAEDFLAMRLLYNKLCSFINTSFGIGV